MQKGKIVQGLFNTQDEKLHRAMKKPIAGIYSMSNLVGFEQYVDSTIDYFFRRLEEAHDITHQPCDLTNWLQWFAFDVMGEITFSKRLGFLEKAHDVDNIISDLATSFQRISWVSKHPTRAINSAKPYANCCRSDKCRGWKSCGRRTQSSTKCFQPKQHP
jgi:hypothetical protein